MSFPPVLGPEGRKSDERPAAALPLLPRASATTTQLTLPFASRKRFAYTAPLPSASHPVHLTISPCRYHPIAVRLSEALGSAGQVMISGYMGLARDYQKNLGLGQQAAWGGEALKHRETMRSIAKRVLTLSFGLGISLSVASRAVFPFLLSAVCPATEVAQLVAQVFVFVITGRFVSRTSAMTGYARFPKLDVL